MRRIYYITRIILLAFMLIATSCNQTARSEAETEEPLCIKSLNLFTLHIVNELLNRQGEPEWLSRGAFIPLTDIHPFSNHPDSLAIPEFVSSVDWHNLLRNVSRDDPAYEDFRIFQQEMREREVLKLDIEYRRRFLERTNIAETDTVFFYNYVTDVLVAIPVNEFEVVGVDRWLPNTTQWDFYFGFHSSYRCEFGEIWDSHSGFDRVLVYVGNTHPFARGGLRAIRWQNIPAEDFPLEKSNIETDNERVLYLMEYGVREDRAFRYEFEHFVLFSQHFMCFLSFSNRWEVRAMHLLIIDTKTDSVVAERVIDDGFGGMLTLVGFIGYLFRNAPPVALDFWIVAQRNRSNSCPFILFLDAEVDDIYIRCDNRRW